MTTDTPIPTSQTKPDILGYKVLTPEMKILMNHMKVLEETCLRVSDMLTALPTTDKRWVAIGNTHLQQAFMAFNRSVAQPERIKLPHEMQDAKPDAGPAAAPVAETTVSPN